MTSSKNIPLDLLYIIFDYAYNTPFLADPMIDVGVQKNIQESIPSCFLMSRLPKPEWFNVSNHPPCRRCWSSCNHTNLCPHCLRKLDCILIPSPFQKGNPYYPSHALEPMFPKFSPTIKTFIGLLSGFACKRNHTYKACALRRAEQLSHAKLGEWNHYYRDFFSKEFLTDPTSFFQGAYPWSKPFIEEVCSQLSKAQFLSFCSPKRP